jgi:hypothetical protein
MEIHHVLLVMLVLVSFLLVIFVVIQGIMKSQITMEAVTLVQMLFQGARPAKSMAIQLNVQVVKLDSNLLEPYAVISLIMSILMEMEDVIPVVV